MIRRPPRSTPLSLHDALPISIAIQKITDSVGSSTNPANYLLAQKYIQMMQEVAQGDKSKTVYLPYEATKDRKSTRLNSSHANISYAVFCLKKKKNKYIPLYLS